MAHVYEHVLGLVRAGQSGIGRLARIRDIGNESDNRTPAELRGVEQRLREQRPALSALELDAVKLRAMASVERRPQTRFSLKKGSFMKSRVALVLVLALGVFMSGTGATLAVSGLAGSGSASSAQYPEEHGERSFCESGSGNSASSGSGCNQSHECTETASEAENGTGTQHCAQVTRQISSGGGGSLPFTGFLAIPVLIVGVGLLGAGVAMRLRMRSGNRPA